MKTVQMDYGDGLISVDLPDSSTIVEYGKTYSDPGGIDSRAATRKASPHNVTFQGRF